MVRLQRPSKTFDISVTDHVCVPWLKFRCCIRHFQANEPKNWQTKWNAKSSIGLQTHQTRGPESCLETLTMAHQRQRRKTMEHRACVASWQLCLLWDRWRWCEPCTWYGRHLQTSKGNVSTRSLLLGHMDQQGYPGKSDADYMKKGAGIHIFQKTKRKRKRLARNNQQQTNFFI